MAVISLTNYCISSADRLLFSVLSCVFISLIVWWLLFEINVYIIFAIIPGLLYYAFTNCIMLWSTID